MKPCNCTTPPTACVAIIAQGRDMTVAWGCPACGTVHARGGFPEYLDWATRVWVKEVETLKKANTSEPLK